MSLISIAAPLIRLAAADDDEGIERCGVAAHGAIEERTV